MYVYAVENQRRRWFTGVRLTKIVSLLYSIAREHEVLSTRVGYEYRIGNGLYAPSMAWTSLFQTSCLKIPKVVKTGAKNFRLSGKVIHHSDNFRTFKNKYCFGT